MIAVETPHHNAYSTNDDTPYKACRGKCLKVWWKSDFEARSSKHCPQCGGRLRPAVEGKHFTVTSRRPGPLQAQDLQDHVNSEGKPIVDAKALKHINVKHISLVKEQFIQQAEKGWR